MPSYADQADFYVLIKVHTDSEQDIFGLDLVAVPGFDPNLGFAQAAANPLCRVPLSNLTTQYHLFANAHKLTFFSVGAGGAVEGGYVGKFLPFANYSEYPMPLFVGSSDLGDGVPHTNRSIYRHIFVRAKKNYRQTSPVYIRWVDGRWLELIDERYAGGLHFNITEYSLNLKTGTGNIYPVFPYTLYIKNTNVIGALDGVYHTTGYNNRVGNVIDTQLGPMVCFQDVYRNDRDDFFCVLNDNNDV